MSDIRKLPIGIQDFEFLPVFCQPDLSVEGRSTVPFDQDGDYDHQR